MKKKDINNEDSKRSKTICIDQCIRRLQWLFFRSGVIPLAFEHFLAMIPATILVPILVNNAFDTMIIDMSLVLFTSGLGTILFLLFSKGQIPAYLGSSFAYIGITMYIIEENLGENTSHAMAFSYVGWTYIISTVLLFLLSFLYRIHGIDRFLSWLLPATVVGPAISLIGLELADTAVVDSGFDIEEGLVDSKAAIVAFITLGVIILFSLLHHKILKNAAIIVGVVSGCIASFVINGFPSGSMADINLLESAKLNFSCPLSIVPPSLSSFFSLAIAAVPATLIVFTENIGRVTVIGRMTSLNEDDDGGIFNKNTVKKLGTSLFSYGIASFAAVVCGSVPNTIYAENIAVMSIHKTQIKRKDPDKFINDCVSPFSIIPYIIAAGLAMLFSFSSALQTLLLGIPKPVIGGMELFLFGIISAPGIQLLVEQRVNYKKISNQIITAAVLISGISGLSITVLDVELKGMSLGFGVGIVLNLIVSFFKWIGCISDVITFDELITDCLSVFSKETDYHILGYKKQDQDNVDYAKECRIYDLICALKGRDHPVPLMNGEIVSDDIIRDEIAHSNLVEIGIGNTTIIKFRKTENGFFVDILSSRIDDKTKTAYLNDFESIIDEDRDWLIINASDHMPMRSIRKLILEIQ